MVEEATCRAAIYAPVPAGYAAQTSSYSTPLAAFSQDGYCLRIGTQAFVPDTTGTYRSFSGVEGRCERYAEDIAGREGIVVLASRFDKLVAHQGYTHPEPRESTDHQSTTDSDGRQPSEEYTDSSSEISGDFQDGGCQELSDCSSSPNGQSGGTTSDEDAISSNSGDSSQSDEYDEDESGGWDSNGYACESDEGIDPSAFSYGQMRPYAAEYLNASGYAMRHHGNGRGGAYNQAYQRVSMRVFLPGGRVFWFFKPTASSLSQSPPVLHPTLPLVVWPLDEREILFVDYDADTHFICRISHSDPEAPSMQSEFVH